MIDPLINPADLKERESELKEYLKQVFQTEDFTEIMKQNRSNPKVNYFLADEIQLIQKLKSDDFDKELIDNTSFEYILTYKNEEFDHEQILRIALKLFDLKQISSFNKIIDNFVECKTLELETLIQLYKPNKVAFTSSLSLKV